MEELKELRVSNDAMNEPEELRIRMAEAGHLFFKRLQNPDKLWALRREMLTTMQEGGWLMSQVPIQWMALQTFLRSVQKAILNTRMFTMRCIS